MTDSIDMDLDDNEVFELSRSQIATIQGEPEDTFLGTLSNNAGLKRDFRVPQDYQPGHIYGIDVSHWQGNIDWARATNAQVAFAYIEATQGATFVDHRVAANIAGAKANELPFGCYHFLSANTALQSQIDNFLRVYEPVHEPGNLPPCMDLEWDYNSASVDRWLTKPRSFIEDKSKGWMDAIKTKLDVAPVFYGTKSPDKSLEQRLVMAMRHPTLCAKMLIQRPEDVNDAVLGSPAPVVPPLDGANDILRLGRLIGNAITEEELEAITDGGLRAFFFKRDEEGNESINRHRAILGDGRNDENLFFAQVQLAWLRLHNRIVDSCPDDALRNAPQDKLFAWAQDQTRLLYQWVVLHDWLKRICDPDVFEHVLNNRAPLYQKLIDRVAPPTGTLPLPVEFSFGAFRFGHSMVRDAYDWNARFDNAGFDLFFAFTGSHKNPMFGITHGKLPSNWPPDWARVVEEPNPSFPQRAARRIDTRVTPPLAKLPDEAGAQVKPQIRNLDTRNLLRGQIVNLRSAQQCIAGIEEQISYTITPLGADQLMLGEVGQMLAGTDLVTHTPLWFYTFKEAEVLAGGERLGPLGSMLVADTIVGLMVNDANSVLNRPLMMGSSRMESPFQPLGMSCGRGSCSDSERIISTSLMESSPTVGGLY